MLLSTFFLLWICAGFCFPGRKQAKVWRKDLRLRDSGQIDNDISGIAVKELTGDVKGKILSAARSFQKGDTILSVDPSQCIFTARDGQTIGLKGQTDFMWEIAGDLRESLSDEMITSGRTWDVQLSLALLEATAGTTLMGEFWDQYTHLLQPPEQITPIFTWNEELIRCLDDEKFYKGALDQKKRLSNLFPDLISPSAHRVTKISVNTINEMNSYLLPTPLEWAFAMVRSRCFQVHEDWFAVIPIMEIANHDQNPNANFVMLGINGPMNYSTPINDILRGKFCLQAIKDIEKDEQILISYKTKSNNRLFLQQYGFSLPSASVIFPDSGSNAVAPLAENTKVEDIAKTQLMGYMIKNFDSLMGSDEDLDTQRRSTIDILITKLETYQVAKILKQDQKNMQDDDYTVDEVCKLFKDELIKEIDNVLATVNTEPVSINGIYEAVKFLTNIIENNDDFKTFQRKLNSHVGSDGVVDLRLFLRDQYNESMSDNGVSMVVNKYQLIALMTYKLQLKFALMDAKMNILSTIEVA